MRPERIALRTGQSLEPIEERRAQLVERGERQLHLGFHAGGSNQRQPAACASR